MVCAAMAATLAVTASVTGTPETAPVHAYFGSLGAYPFTIGESGGYRGAFETARTSDRMDFLGIAGRAPTAALQRSAASMSAEFDARFVAMWGWQYASTDGNSINVLEPDQLDENTAPAMHYDLFFRQWLPRYRGGTLREPIVLLPQPRDLAFDFDLNDFASRSPLAEAASPFVRTVEIIADQSSAPSVALDRSEWTRYLKYLNAGLRVAPTADVERSARTGYAASHRRTVILAQKLTKAHLLDSIRERRVYSSEDSNLRVSFSINGVHMGSIVAMKHETPLRIDVTFSDPDEPASHYWVSLRRDAPGGAIEAARELAGTDHAGDGRVVFTQFKRSRHDEYFLLRIQQMGSTGIDSVWTAPIWLVGSGTASSSSGFAANPGP
jgi:hypothetical protein